MTHESKHKHPAQVTLDILFDADQNNDSLVIKPVREAHHEDTPNPSPIHGVRANSLYFVEGEQVSVRVIGSGFSDKLFDSFQVIDCTFITRPQMVPLPEGELIRYSPPSPFVQADGACYSLAPDFRATVETHRPHHHHHHDGPTLRVVSHEWKRTLDVNVNKGNWYLSLVLTVRIVRGAGSISEIRVFSTDPECEVGAAGTF